jgi:hypothetical protein
MDSGMHCVVGIFNLDITYATKIDFWSFLSSGRERLTALKGVVPVGKAIDIILKFKNEK